MRCPCRTLLLDGLIYIYSLQRATVTCCLTHYTWLCFALPIQIASGMHDLVVNLQIIH